MKLVDCRISTMSVEYVALYRMLEEAQKVGQ